ncbi:MAG: hypothetical protein ACREJ5_27445, partial [Geminicoccaceae bacterium]
MTPIAPAHLRAWLEWYEAMGVVEPVGEHPIDRLRPAPPGSPPREESSRSGRDARPVPATPAPPSQPRA